MRMGKARNDLRMMARHSEAVRTCAVFGSVVYFSL